MMGVYTLIISAAGIVWRVFGVFAIASWQPAVRGAGRKSFFGTEIEHATAMNRRKFFVDLKPAVH